MESVHWVDVECPLTIYPNPKPSNLNPKSCFKTEMDDAHWVDVERPLTIHPNPKPCNLNPKSC